MGVFGSISHPRRACDRSSECIGSDAVRKLVHRPRRLRRSAGLRNLVRETKLNAHDFILPLFVSENVSEPRAIASMPGVFQLPIAEVAAEAERAHRLGLQAVVL